MVLRAMQARSVPTPSGACWAVATRRHEARHADVEAHKVARATRQHSKGFSPQHSFAAYIEVIQLDGLRVRRGQQGKHTLGHRVEAGDRTAKGTQGGAALLEA